MGKGGQERLVERPAGIAVQRRPARPVGDEPRPLLAGIGQFHEGIGQFQAADEQLEPLGDARIGRVAAGQRGLRRRPMGQEGGPVAADARLDPFQQQAEEQILPGLAGAQRGAGLARPAPARRPAVASRSAPT